MQEEEQIENNIQQKDVIADKVNKEEAKEEETGIVDNYSDVDGTILASTSNYDYAKKETTSD